MTRTTMLALFSVLAIGLLIPAYADNISPLKQYNMGIPIDEIQCNDDKVLMQSTSGKPACLNESTAAKLADRGFTIVTLKEKIDEISVNVSVEPQVTVLQVASPVPFVDDGREYNRVLQKHPGPTPIYDKIMGYDLVIGNNDVSENNDVSGTASFSSPPHEKYSKNQGVGLYMEDWMPTYIVPGYRLLYAYDNYIDYSVMRDPPRSTNNIHSVGYYYVPNDFVLHSNVTDTSLYRQSDGYGVVAKISSTPYDEIEDRIERIREHRASQSGDYSEFREMTREGKTVYAYQGGNDLNFYSANVGFDPDEYTIMYVKSVYLTLDELIPVFESMMN